MITAAEQSIHLRPETISFLLLKYVSKTKNTLRYAMTPTAVISNMEFTGVGSLTKKLDDDGVPYEFTVIEIV